ncbi:riboflavin synthase [candidate division KSB1 bacterium]|nr:riboflavin synthase [candidate division KSB1 bacterium]
MFTGLIEEIGIITDFARRGAGLKLEVHAEKIMTDLKIDDSVAVDGVCLTATEIHAASFTMDVSPETISKTTLKQLKTHQRVNLERALRLNDRLGGHIVQGHVDGIGRVARIAGDPSRGDWYFHVPHDFMKYIILKGSIAINGVSLTVADKSGDQIGVSIIPHTLRATTFQYMREGDAVNIELDFFAKYIEQFINKPGISMDWLREQGFE